MKKTMSMQLGTTEGGEQGSALILSVLITVIMSLLGISYLMMAKTENMIAENERNSLLSLYVAEAGARLAIGWFNDPTAAGYLVPGTSDVDRSLRLRDPDNDLSTTQILASAGNDANPVYKDAAITNPAGPLFDRPFRSAIKETFLGIETGSDPDSSNATRGPDLVVSQTHLDAINADLFPDFPSSALQARVTRIEMYSPPVVSIGGVDTRMGIATIKVIGGVFIYPGTGDERQIATRVVKAVVNELPIPGPGGPLQSCNSLAYTGAFEIHWGPASSVNVADLGLTPGNIDNKASSGIPYAINDPFSFFDDGTVNLGTWATDKDGSTLEDPWFAYIAGGALADVPNATNPTEVQPWQYDASGYPGSLPNVDTDHTNLFQNTVLTCPTFEHGLWKQIAQSGNKNHFYYKWVANDTFKQDGVGTAASVLDLTLGKTGVFFFDSINGQPWDGKPWTDATNNLTPAVTINSNTWGIRGFMYMNMDQFSTQGVGGGGINTFMLPPGEPGDGSGFVNLNYPGNMVGSYTISDGTAATSRVLNTTTGEYWCTDYTDCAGNVQSATPIQDEYGEAFYDTTVLDGVMYNSGTMQFAGNANYYGSVIAEQGLIVSTGNPAFWFDESLVKGNWPKKGMDLPRVVVTLWQTDL